MTVRTASAVLSSNSGTTGAGGAGAENGHRWEDEAGAPENGQPPAELMLLSEVTDPDSPADQPVVSRSNALLGSPPHFSNAAVASKWPNPAIWISRMALASGESSSANTSIQSSAFCSARALRTEVLRSCEGHSIAASFATSRKVGHCSAGTPSLASSNPFEVTISGPPVQLHINSVTMYFNPAA